MSSSPFTRALKAERKAWSSFKAKRSHKNWKRYLRAEGRVHRMLKAPS